MGSGLKGGREEGQGVGERRPQHWSSCEMTWPAQGVLREVMGLRNVG